MVNDDELMVRMMLLHSHMERRGPGAATGDTLAQNTASRVLFTLLDDKPARHEAAWRAFTKRRSTERRTGR